MSYSDSTSSTNAFKRVSQRILPVAIFIFLFTGDGYVDREYPDTFPIAGHNYNGQKKYNKLENACFLTRFRIGDQQRHQGDYNLLGNSNQHLHHNRLGTVLCAVWPSRCAVEHL